MTPRCPLCGGVVVGAHFHGIDPEQRCDACDTLADLRGAAVCACSLAALRRGLAEQAAGEAERTAQAVAREREDRERDHANHLDGWAACILADDERDALDARAIARDMRADAARIRARATSPAPEPADGSLPIGEPAPYYLGGRGYRTLDAVRAATDAHAARLGRQCQAIDHEGGVVYVAPAPEPVAAERGCCEMCGDVAVECDRCVVCGSEVDLDALAAARKGGGK